MEIIIVNNNYYTYIQFWVLAKTFSYSCNYLHLFVQSPSLACVITGVWINGYIIEVRMRGFSFTIICGCKWVDLISFQDQSESLGGAIEPIVSSVRLSEAPKALSESNRSLLQEIAAFVAGF